MMLRTHVFLLFFFSFSWLISAQTERKMTRKGNSQYETGNFVDAEINYKKALEKNKNLLEAQFNLGDALVKQERYDEALESFDNVSSLTNDKELKAKALHNIGNVLLSQQNLEGALESYKESLRVDPKDEETRYNYAFVKKQIQQQEQEEQDQENEKSKDDNDNASDDSNNDEQDEGSENEDSEDSNSEENDQNNNQQDQNNRGETDGDDVDEEKDGQSPKPRENKLSPEEAQRLLEALNQQEDQVQEKMKKHKLKGAQVKIEKDW